MNYAATAAELGSAALLLSRRTARAGGLAAFATFAVVWVANLQHAIDGGIPGAPGVIGSPQVAWIRAPLQIPLLWWAWRVAGGRRGPLINFDETASDRVCPVVAADSTHYHP